MIKGELREREEGIPQGGIISPILANVYLNYVLDVWYTYKIKPKMKGQSVNVRYADDFVILFEYEEDAMKIMNLLKVRLWNLSLEVAKDKIQVLPFGAKTETKETFDFVGFNFYKTKTQKGELQRRPADM